MEWLEAAEDIFLTLDGGGVGHITADLALVLYLAVRFNDGLGYDSLRSGSQTFLGDLRHCMGYVTLRDFKNWLLYNKYRTLDSLKILKTRLGQLVQHMVLIKSKLLRT
jgi:hypothetical protein